MFDVAAQSEAIKYPEAFDRQVLARKLEKACEEVTRLRMALGAIANDPDTNIEASVYAHNALMSSQQ